jgi:peptidoglycan/LPS O-acetylase OafA/YrhL
MGFGPRSPETKESPGGAGVRRDEEAEPGRMPQLDGLRALAVGAIVCHHWLPLKFQFGLPLSAGVQLFFVLSGFLITGLLLDARAKRSAAGLGSILRSWRNFYARRVLRLFPLYYVVLGVVTLVGLVDFRNDFTWHFFYATNYGMALRSGWMGQVSHFWTLAVEEQFYLLWPFVVLLAPLRWLPVLLGFVVAIGPAFRAGTDLWLPQWQMSLWATPAHFDSLGIGAVVAWLFRHPTPWWQGIVRRRAAVTSGLIAAAVAMFAFPPSMGARNLQLCVLSVTFAMLVAHSAIGASGVVGWALQNPATRYVGRISYGIYLLHNLAVPAVSAAWEAMPWLARIPGAWPLTMCLFTFGGAALSWRWFERPINSLKRYVPY